MPRYGADIDQMASIAGRLSGVVQSLDSEAHGGFDTSALGHPEAVGALEQFIANWSHGRSEISTGVRGVHETVVASSTNYATVERVESTAYTKAAGRA